MFANLIIVAVILLVILSISGKFKKGSIVFLNLFFRKSYKTYKQLLKTGDYIICHSWVDVVDLKNKYSGGTIYYIIFTENDKTLCKIEDGKDDIVLDVVLVKGFGCEYLLDDLIKNKC